MEQLTCQYCNTVVTDKYSLARHQKSKKCLSIQGAVNTESFKCSECDFSVNRKYLYKKHIASCVPYIEATLSEEYEGRIFELEDKNAEQAKRIKELEEKLYAKPTIIQNNNFLINAQPLTAEHLESFTRHLNYEDHLGRGAQGLLEYAINYPLKDNISCTDIARRILCYLDENGKLMKDRGGKTIVTKFFQSIRPAALAILGPKILALDIDDNDDGDKAAVLQDLVSIISSACTSELRSEYVQTFLDLLTTYAQAYN